MAKFQEHKYIYRKDDDVSPGHIKFNSADTALCGASLRDIGASLGKSMNVRTLKSYIVDRPICRSCELAFRKRLVSVSNLVDRW